VRSANDYPFEVRHLPAGEGGGYLVTFLDYPDCIGHGDTPEAAIEEALGNMAALLEVAEEEGLSIPDPGGASGQLVLRLPKTLHARVKARAKREGVSLNTLLVSLVAEGMGARRGKRVA
jgi:antitoxin HicB